MTAHTDPEDHTVTTPDHYARGLELLTDAEAKFRAYGWEEARTLAILAQAHFGAAAIERADAGGREHQAEETP